MRKPLPGPPMTWGMLPGLVCLALGLTFWWGFVRAAVAAPRPFRAQALEVAYGEWDLTMLGSSCVLTLRPHVGAPSPAGWLTGNYTWGNDAGTFAYDRRARRLTFCSWDIVCSYRWSNSGDFWHVTLDRAGRGSWSDHGVSPVTLVARPGRN